MIKNILKHTGLVLKHKWIVFKLCTKVGMPFRGLKHDLSKFSPTEFWESVKYYNGERSPIVFCKKENGYSKAWLHHKGRNKHHYEYWYDINAPKQNPIIPYKYVAEMICDKLAASIAYGGKNWTNGSELEYWMKEKQTAPVNNQVSDMLTEVFEQVAKDGIDKTITKANLKKLYKQYCES